MSHYGRADFLCPQPAISRPLAFDASRAAVPLYLALILSAEKVLPSYIQSGSVVPYVHNSFALEFFPYPLVEHRVDLATVNHWGLAPSSRGLYAVEKYLHRPAVYLRALVVRLYLLI